MPASPHRKVVKAIVRKLRRLLYVVLFILAILIANSAYLATVTALEWFAQRTYQNYFYQLMFLAHLTLGLVVIVPFIVFAAVHVGNTRFRRNGRAVRVGYALLVASVAILLTGLLLFRVGGLELKNPTGRSLVYWIHVTSPLAAVWLYILHRLAGPKIKWKYGVTYTGLCPPHWVDLDFGPLPDRKTVGGDDASVFLVMTGWILPTDTSLNIQIDQNPDLGPIEFPSVWVPDAAEPLPFRTMTEYPPTRVQDAAINRVEAINANHLNRRQNYREFWYRP